jgi:hypothetical protein
MEKTDCEKLTKEMRECVSENKGSHNCKEIIEKFETLCIDYTSNVEDIEKQILSSE